MSSRGVRLSRLDLWRKELREVEDEVAVDEAVCIFVNDEYFGTLMASPTMKRELVVGHLIGEGVIDSAKEVRSLEVTPLKVYVELDRQVDLRIMSESRLRLITTACGSTPVPMTAEQLGPLRVSSDLRVEAGVIFEMMGELNKRSGTFGRTGGTHSAMLYSPAGGVLSFAEDVGRHNAVDKVLGAAAVARSDTGACLLACSGRLSGDIVLKAARSGIPITASFAGPLETGVRIAEASGMTLIGFVRGRRMNVYTHPHRVHIGAQPSSSGS